MSIICRTENLFCRRRLRGWYWNIYSRWLHLCKPCWLCHPRRYWW